MFMEGVYMGNDFHFSTPHSHLIYSLQILQTAVGVTSSPHVLQERLLGIPLNLPT